MQAMKNVLNKNRNRMLVLHLAEAVCALVLQ